MRGAFFWRILGVALLLWTARPLLFLSAKVVEEKPAIDQETQRAPISFSFVFKDPPAEDPLKVTQMWIEKFLTPLKGSLEGEAKELRGRISRRLSSSNDAAIAGKLYTISFRFFEEKEALGGHRITLTFFDFQSQTLDSSQDETWLQVHKEIAKFVSPLISQWLALGKKEKGGIVKIGGLVTQKI